MDYALLVPIALFAAIAYSIKAVVDARVRKQLVSSNGSPELVANILQGDETNRRLSSLRWGITLVMLSSRDRPSSSPTGSTSAIRLRSRWRLATEYATCPIHDFSGLSKRYWCR